MDADLFGMVLARVAKNVKTFRTERTGAKLTADDLGVDQSALSRFENRKGNPSLKFLVTLAAGLDKDISELFAMDAPHRVPPNGPTQIEVTEAIRDALLQIVGEIGAGLIKHQTVSKTTKPRRQTPDPGDRKTGSG